MNNTTMSTHRRRRKTEPAQDNESDAFLPEPKRTSKRKRNRKVVFEDPETVGQWTSVGASRGLSSDADIASFLLSLYSERREKTAQPESSCIHCGASMVLCCLDCRRPSSQAPPTMSQFGPSRNPPPQAVTTTDSNLSSSASSVSVLGTRTEFPCVGQESLRAASVEDKGTSKKARSESDNSETAFPRPDPSDVTNHLEECEQDGLHCSGLVGPFHHHHHDKKKHSGECFSNVYGEETDYCAQVTQPDMPSSAQGGHTSQREEMYSESVALGVETKQESEIIVPDFPDHAELQECSSPHAEAEQCICPVCHQILPSSQHRSHIRTHYSSQEEEGVFSCSACAKTFPHFHTFYNHVRLAANDQRCGQCGDVFVSGCQVGRHRRQHARERDRFCEQCQRSFPAMTKKDFDRHLKKHQKKLKGRTASDAVLCPHCGKVFKNKDCLNTHMTYHNKDSPFPCPLCPKAFKNKACLRQHMLFHGEKTQQCEICGAKFYRKVGLRRHMQKHTGKEFACEECTRRFFSLSELQVHVESVHKGIRRFPCSLCELKFYKAASLKVHMRTHTGEKPFSCDLCQASFAMGEALRKHKRRHTGEKPFRCEDCGQTYSCQYSYKTHRRKHHKDSRYVCTDCHQGFPVLSSLTFHRKMYHDGGQGVYADRCPSS
ncbi:uncharacterized protein LOC143277164 [Babylonia areolata]|uniref:uncharacterized protein LOC143277164 n=1 Tax=Babylonia areolata TaxID=304850 RepID=UPI003FD00BA1